MRFAAAAAVYALSLAVPGLAAAQAAEQTGPKPGTVVPPAVTKEVKPSYPPEAMAAGIQGAVKDAGPLLGSPEVYKPGDGVEAPEMLKDVKPMYTADAKRAGIQGKVVMDCVVLPDGRVGDVRVTRKLDPGLDGEAVKALKQWRFRPGHKDGKAVPVQISVEMPFTLQ